MHIFSNLTIAFPNLGIDSKQLWAYIIWQIAPATSKQVVDFY